MKPTISLSSLSSVFFEDGEKGALSQERMLEREGRGLSELGFPGNRMVASLLTISSDR